jgi:hypothetical protein
MLDLQNMQESEFEILQEHLKHITQKQIFKTNTRAITPFSVCCNTDKPSMSVATTAGCC